jgi:AcrR family transcriptional regulator
VESADGGDDVDPTQVGESPVRGLAQRGGVGDVQRGAPEPFAVADREVVEAVRAACGGGDAVAPLRQLLGEVAADKRSIYMRFGTKEELFDKVVADGMSELARAVSIDAGALFDGLRRRPHITRPHLWAGLERQRAIGAEVDEYRRNVAAVEAAQGAGRVRTDIPAVELMAMVIALVISWDTASWSLEALREDDGHESSAGRRAAVTAAVTDLVRPLRTGPENAGG